MSSSGSTDTTGPSPPNDHISIIAEPEHQKSAELSIVRDGDQKPHVIAFVNHNSGSGKGDELTRMLINAIGEENIYRLGGVDGNPKTIISTVHETHPEFRIIVCGGDGSVNWILSVIADLGYDNVAVGIIPNGTGNDTSRYLGWGQCQFNSETTHGNINKMCDPSTPTRSFDRWQLFMSFRKDEMLARTKRLDKSDEVPMSHIMQLKSNSPPNSNGSSFASVNKKNNEQQSLQESTSTNISSSSTTTSGDNNNTNQSNGIETYYFPKYFKCMVLLDELQFLERYKWLHESHQPQSFLSLSPSDRLLAQQRLSQPIVDQSGKLVDTMKGLNVDAKSKEEQKKVYAQQLENASKWFRFTWSFNNYFSLGIDAQVMNYFGIHRDNNPGCYLCRCCTLTWIGTCSTATCVKCQKKQLRYRIDILYKEGDLTPANAIPTSNKIQHPIDILPPTHPLDKKGRPIDNNKQNENEEGVDIVVYTAEPTLEDSIITSWASQDELPFIDNPQHLANDYKWLSATFDPLSHEALVLLNIPSYAGGRNIWGTKSQMNKKNEGYLVEEFPQDTSDGRLELVAFDGFQQMQFTVMTQSATYRLGQLQGLRIYMEMDGFVQLDGEAWIQPQGIIEIYRSKEGKMLFNDNPDYPCC